MKALLVLLLAVPAAAQPSHLEDQGFAPQLVELKDSSVTITSSALPNGAATEATLITISTTAGATKNRLDLFATKTDTQPVIVTSLPPIVFQTTQPVSITSLPPNTIIVSTALAATPIQRTQAINGTLYRASSGVKNSGMAESPMLLFVNLSTNTLNAYIDKAFLSSLSGGTDSTFRIYRNPIVSSSGTAVGIYPGLFNFATPSKMQVFFNPTTTSNGQNTFIGQAGSGMIPLDFQQAHIVIPGKKFLMTVQNSANNRDTAVVLQWSEE